MDEVFHHLTLELLLHVLLLDLLDLRPPWTTELFVLRELGAVTGQDTLDFGEGAGDTGDRGGDGLLKDAW